MSKRKGLSVDEKRSRMLEFFYEKKDFFQLKELEKQCQKEKGITSMTVKEILTSLVDDGLVNTDKIGTCVYFWAFPGAARQGRKKKIDELKQKISELETKKTKLQQAITEEQKGKEQSVERDMVLEKLSQKISDRDRMVQELQAFKENDPETIDKLKAETLCAHEAANRWTDNIFAIKAWIKAKFSVEDSVIDKQFGIPEDLDYLN